MESFKNYWLRMTTKADRPELQKLVHPLDQRQEMSGFASLPDVAQSRERFSIVIVGESPGPSLDDVREYVEELGFDWRSFVIEPSSEGLVLNG